MHPIFPKLFLIPTKCQKKEYFQNINNNLIGTTHLTFLNSFIFKIIHSKGNSAEQKVVFQQAKARKVHLEEKSSKLF